MENPNLSVAAARIRATMPAMVLDQAGLPLRPIQLPVSQPLAQEMQVKVSTTNTALVM